MLHSNYDHKLLIQYKNYYINFKVSMHIMYETKGVCFNEKGRKRVLKTDMVEGM